MADPLAPLDMLVALNDAGWCYSLICDDAGHWACVFDGIQNDILEPPGDITTSFWVPKAAWHDTPEEAIATVYTEGNEQCPS